MDKQGKVKETFGVEIGDKILCHWEDWTEDKIRNKKLTGVVFAIDHNGYESKDWATFHLITGKGDQCWFCGEPTKILSRNNKIPKHAST